MRFVQLVLIILANGFEFISNVMFSQFVANQRNVTFSMDFEIPMKNTRNIFVFAEIKKALDFSNDNLFIQYSINLPEGTV